MLLVTKTHQMQLSALGAQSQEELSGTFSPLVPPCPPLCCCGGGLLAKLVKRLTL